MKKSSAKSLMRLNEEIARVLNKMNPYESFDSVYNGKNEINKLLHSLADIINEEAPSTRLYSVVLGDGNTLDFEERNEAYEYYDNNRETACEIYSYDCYGSCHTLKQRNVY